MGFIDRFKAGWKNAISAEEVSMNDRKLLEWLGIDSGSVSRDSMSEITYFTCLRMLSETVGKLPLKYYQEDNDGRKKAELSDVARLLAMSPNAIMTPTTLWSTVEMNRQHYGNGYVWMRGDFSPSGRYGGSYSIKDLWVLPAQYVSVMMDDAGVFGGKGRLYYKYTDSRTGTEYTFNQEEVLHFKTWFSFDGIMGSPVREILANTVGGSNEAQNYMNNLYKNGLTASMALQYTGDFDEKKVELLKKKFADKLTGSQNAGKVIPVPIGLQLTPLKMSLADAQFIELRKYSALQIAGAFGIKPNQINSYDRSSYANSESQQIEFLVDTMSYQLKAYEEEINKKVLTAEQQKQGFFYKFNEKAILRTDSASQMESLSKAVNNGIYTPNEARNYLDMPSVEGGDTLIVNGNYIPITDVGKQYDNQRKENEQ